MIVMKLPMTPISPHTKVKTPSPQKSTFLIKVEFEFKVPPVYLHLIFEISSVTWFFFQFRNINFKKLKINLFSKLIFAGYTGSKNQVRTWQKIKFVSNSIFFRVCNKLPNWHFKNQAQIDTANVCFLDPVTC